MPCTTCPTVSPSASRSRPRAWRSAARRARARWLGPRRDPGRARQRPHAGRPRRPDRDRGDRAPDDPPEVRGAGVILFGLAGIAVNGTAVAAMWRAARGGPQPARRAPAHRGRRGRLGRRGRGRRAGGRVRLGRGRSDHRARRLRAVHRLRPRPDRGAGPDPARARAVLPRPRGDRPGAVRRGGRAGGARRPRVDDHERLRRRLGARDRGPRRRPARPAAPARGGAAGAVRRHPHDDPGRPRPHFATDHSPDGVPRGSQATDQRTYATSTTTNRTGDPTSCPPSKSGRSRPSARSPWTRSKGELGPSGDGDGSAGRLPPLRGADGARPGRSALAGSRSVRTVVRPRLHPPVLGAAPRGLRGLASTTWSTFGVGLGHARPPGAARHAGHRDHHRPTRAGCRQRDRDGARGADAGGALQPARPRDRRPLDVLHLLRRRPPGGRLRRGVVDRRPPAARSPDLLLRRQPHLDRGRHRALLLRGRRGALPRLRLARAALRRVDARRPAGRRPRVPRRPAAEHGDPADAHRARRAPQAGTRRAHTASRSARRSG